VETHEVNFSIGVCGSYLLHINLRKPHTPWPSAPGQSPRGVGDGWQVKGSPFVLRVSPGKANPFMTKMPHAKLVGHAVHNMAGRPIPMGKVEVMLQTCDKMGNRCDAGGAAVTCGFLEESASPMASTETENLCDDIMIEAEDDDPDLLGRRSATCTDCSDGKYLLRWCSTSSQACRAFVKIDGLHIVGSPIEMDLSEVEVVLKAKEQKKAERANKPASRTSHVFSAHQYGL